MMKIIIKLFLLINLRCIRPNVHPVTLSNRSALDDYRVTMLNFVGPECRFSKQLWPVFQVASEFFIKETQESLVLFGVVNCAANEDFCDKEKIERYPTIKVLRYGYMMKSEYRGPRRAEAIIDFVEREVKNNVAIFDARQKSISDVLRMVPVEKNTVFGIFPSNYSTNVHYHFYKIAAHLERDNCLFYLIHNVTDEGEFMILKEAVTNQFLEIVRLNGTDLVDMQKWMIQKCAPNVRELTFENAEELISEEKPLFLYFYNPETKNLRATFHEVVRKYFQYDKNWINFVTVNGLEFIHPLLHMNKTNDELPLIVIDSLSHMYAHPKSPQELFNDPNLLRKFLNDFYSGKLHYEYHLKEEYDGHRELFPKNNDMHPLTTTQIVESAFKKLGPSPLKYTLRHDEL